MANNEQGNFEQQGQNSDPAQDQAYVPGLIQEQSALPTQQPNAQDDMRPQRQWQQQPSQSQQAWQPQQPQQNQQPQQTWQPQQPDQWQQANQQWQNPQNPQWQQPQNQQWQQPQGQPNRQWQQPQNTGQQQQQNPGPRFSGPIRQDDEPSLLTPPWSQKMKDYRAAHPIDEPKAITWLGRLGYFAMGAVGGFIGVMAVWLFTASLSPVRKNEAFWIAWLGLAVHAFFMITIGFGNGGGSWVGSGSLGGTGTEGSAGTGSKGAFG